MPSQAASRPRRQSLRPRPRRAPPSRRTRTTTTTSAPPSALLPPATPDMPHVEGLRRLGLRHPAGKKVGTCAPRVIRAAAIIGGRARACCILHTFRERDRDERRDRPPARRRTRGAREHRRVRAIAELMALRPTWLSPRPRPRWATRSVTPSERSTCSCGSRASGRSSTVAGRGRAPLARPPPTSSTTSLLHGGAIERRRRPRRPVPRLASTDPELRDFYDMIVVDESRHAALFIKTLRWLADHALQT